MTVHGAKGLEAPIVILPDTAKPRRGLKATIWPAGDAAVWPPASADLTPALQEIKDELEHKQELERRRLLYVAMTRAENWLIIAGAGKDAESDGGWYEMVSTALEERGGLPRLFPTGEGLRLGSPHWGEGNLATVNAGGEEELDVFSLSGEVK